MLKRVKNFSSKYSQKLERCNSTAFDQILKKRMYERAKSSEDQMRYLKDGLSEQFAMNLIARTFLLNEGSEKSRNKSL